MVASAARGRVPQVKADVSEPSNQEKSRSQLLEEIAELRANVAALSLELDKTRQDSAAISRVLRSTISTSKKSLEDLIDASRNSAAAARAKAQFLANMSHELRTPMTAILGFADLLIEEGDLSRAPSSRIERLHTIKRNATHLMQLLSDVLDLSRLESGEIDVQRTVTSPLEILAEIESVMRDAAEAKGLRFDIEYHGAIPREIQTDPVRLRQILIHTVGNAIKFTEHGSVVLSVELMRPEKQPPALQIRVTDSGVGIPREGLDGIFDAFSQGDSSMTRKFGGTGLGLTISRQLARLLGGDIEVETTEGEGSCFKIRVDAGSLDGVERIEDPSVHARTCDVLLDEDDSTRAFLDRTRGTASGARILLVEDGEDNRRLISFTLKKAGFDVSHAENGAVGVDHALAAHEAGEAFDLILMDMQMPVMDGYEASRRLRESGYDLPIIALTAHALAGDRQRCLDAGCTDFATKPIDRRRLVKLVLRYLQKRNNS